MSTAKRTHPFEGLPQNIVAMIMRAVHDGTGRHGRAACFSLRLVSRATRDITAPLYAALGSGRPRIVAPSHTWYPRIMPGVSAQSLASVRRLLTSESESLKALTIQVFCRAFWRGVASVSPTLDDIAAIGEHLAAHPDDNVELELRADFLQARTRKEALELRGLATLRSSITRARVCYIPPRQWQLALMRKMLPASLQSLALRECRLTNTNTLHDLLLGLPCLEVLDLFGNTGLAFTPLVPALSSMTAMRKLSIGKLAGVDTDGLASVLEKMPVLISLNVRACLSSTTARLARALGRVRSLDASWCDLDLDEMISGLGGLDGISECAIEALDLTGNATIFAPRAGVDPYATFGAVMRAMPKLADVRVQDTNADPNLLLACLHSLRRRIRCLMRTPAGECPAAEGLVTVIWAPLAYERAHW